MLEKFEHELRQLKIEDVVTFINSVKGYKMLDNTVGYHTLKDNFIRKKLTYATKYFTKKDNYGYWEICWNKVWDKTDEKFFYKNQLRFSLLDYEFVSLDDELNEEQQRILKNSIRNYIKANCHSYKDAIKDVFNKQREEIDKQEEETLLNY